MVLEFLMAVYIMIMVWGIFHKFYYINITLAYSGLELVHFYSVKNCKQTNKQTTNKHSVPETR